MKYVLRRTRKLENLSLAPLGDAIESLQHEDMTVCDIITGTGSVELPRFLCEIYRRGCELLSPEHANEF